MIGVLVRNNGEKWLWYLCNLILSFPLIYFSARVFSTSPQECRGNVFSLHRGWVVFKCWLSLVAVVWGFTLLHPHLQKRKWSQTLSASRPELQNLWQDWVSNCGPLSSCIRFHHQKTTTCDLINEKACEYQNWSYGAACKRPNKVTWWKILDAHSTPRASEHFLEVSLEWMPKKVILQ